MAVTGDIDLTLGLDFYRHKKEYKSNHLIPWARKAKEYIKSTVSNFNISYTNNSNNTISVRYNLSSSYIPEEEEEIMSYQIKVLLLSFGIGIIISLIIWILIQYIHL